MSRKQNVICPLGLGAGPRFHGPSFSLSAPRDDVAGHTQRKTAQDCAKTAKIEAGTGSMHDQRFEFDHAAQHHCNRKCGYVTVSTAGRFGKERLSGQRFANKRRANTRAQDTALFSPEPPLRSTKKYTADPQGHLQPLRSITPPLAERGTGRPAEMELRSGRTRRHHTGPACTQERTRPWWTWAARRTLR